MADTIFGQTPLSAAIGGYKDAVDLGNYREQQTAQTSILSDKATASRIAVTDLKEQQATTLAERAALQSSALRNSDADMNTLSGKVKVYQSALQENRSNPVLVQKIQNDLNSTFHEAAMKAQDNMQLRQEQQTEVYDNVMSAFDDPTTGAENLRNGAMNISDPTLRQRALGISQILADKHPIPNSMGQKVPFSQLSPQEQEDFKDKIQQGLAPSAELKGLLAINKMKIDEAKAQEAQRFHETETARKTKADANIHADRQDVIKEKERHDSRDESLKALKELTDKTLKEKKSANDQQAALAKMNYPGQIKRAQADLDKAKKEADRLQYKLPGASIPEDVTKAVENRQKELDRLQSDYHDALGVVTATKTAEANTKAAAKAYTREAPAKPATAEEASKLPKGSYFLTPSGELRQI